MLQPPTIGRVIVYTLYNKSTHHDIFKNSFEATFLRIKNYL